MKRKEILAGGIVRDILFRTVEDMEGYLEKLAELKHPHKVLETFERTDRSVIIRIVTQYNNAPLIQLYKDEQGRG